MSSFPLTIDGTTFSNTTLGGKRYVRNFPDLLQAVANHSALGEWHTAEMVTSRKYYPRLGSASFYVTPYRSFAIGMFVFAVVNRAMGISTPYFYGTVTAYTPRTGLLVLEIEGHSNGSLAAGTMVFCANAQRYHVNQSGALGIADGGTGASSLAAAQSNLEIAVPATQAAELFDDFVRYAGSGFAYSELSKVGTAAYTQDVATAAYDSYRAGFLELGVSAVSDNLTLARTNGIHAAGGNFTYVASVYLPTLSDGTNRYLFQIGMKGSNSSSTSIFSYSGLGFSYQDDVNGGKWLLHYGKDGTVTTVDSGVTVNAATWYKLEIRWDGTNVVFYIEGASVGSFSSGIPNTGSNNVCLPAMQLTKTVGTSERLAIIDYIYRQKKGTR